MFSRAENSKLSVTPYIVESVNGKPKKSWIFALLESSRFQLEQASRIFSQAYEFCGALVSKRICAWPSIKFAKTIELVKLFYSFMNYVIN